MQDVDVMEVAAFADVDALEPLEKFESDDAVLVQFEMSAFDDVDVLEQVEMSGISDDDDDCCR